MSSGGKKT
jgi:hypothetical protein